MDVRAVKPTVLRVSPNNIIFALSGLKWWRIMCMKIKACLIEQIESDLQLNAPFVKGVSLPVRNCWHFSTDGNSVDTIFYDDSDFKDGMNRIYLISRKYKIVILSFVLMDNHIHFVLYGEFDECNKFVHEYVRITSQYISEKHNEFNKLSQVSVNYQVVDTDLYLRTVICYVIKNPVAAGLPYYPWTYPWSCGFLYFSDEEAILRQKNAGNITVLSGTQEKRHILKTRENVVGDIMLTDGVIFQDEYVAYDLVKRIYRTPRSLMYFIGKWHDEEVESRGGLLSHLSMPLQELRRHKREFCRQLFGKESVKYLNMTQRLYLARTLKRNYNSSPKQIVKVCGLKYGEVKDK